MFYIRYILMTNKLHVSGSIVINQFYSNWRDYLDIFDITMLWYAANFILYGRFFANKVDWRNCMAQGPFQQK